MESDLIFLSEHETNAVFLGVRQVDILKVRGLEFHHLYIILLMRDPALLNPEFAERTLLFYDMSTRNGQDKEVRYYEASTKKDDATIWETTISASSECGYDSSAGRIGNLIKTPNFERIAEQAYGKRVFSKKIVSNNLDIINRMLEFELIYNNSLDYSLLPEISQGYNSNSFISGIIKYSGLQNVLTVPSCFKAPGISKPITL